MANTLLHRTAELGDVLIRNLDTEDLIGHVLALNALFEVRLHLALVTGVGVQNVPVTGDHHDLIAELLKGINAALFFTSFSFFSFNRLLNAGDFFFRRFSGVFGQFSLGGLVDFDRQILFAHAFLLGASFLAEN